MNYYLAILPVTLLVSYSQLIVKWRTQAGAGESADSLLGRLLAFLKDPILMSAYAAALLASFVWLFVVARLPLAVAFPIYIGSTFLLVLLGSFLLLGETVSLIKIIAALLILAGILLGVSADA
jgi:multidrug transporter EmrE-like cation transporter